MFADYNGDDGGEHGNADDDDHSAVGGAFVRVMAPFGGDAYFFVLFHRFAFAS